MGLGCSRRRPSPAAPLLAAPAARPADAPPVVPAAAQQAPQPTPVPGAEAGPASAPSALGAASPERLARAAAAGRSASRKLAGAGAVEKTPVLPARLRETAPYYVVLRSRSDVQPARGFLRTWDEAKVFVCVPPSLRGPAREAVFHRWETYAEAEVYWTEALGPAAPRLARLVRA